MIFKKKNDETDLFTKMTTAPIEKLLVSLSIPTIISMLVTTLYNIVDTAFVGMLGTSQSAATGVVNGFMAILQAVAFMCGQGSGSIMSRMLGQKKNDEATKYASTGFFMSLSLGLTISVLSFIFMQPLLNLLGCTVTIAPYAKTYLTYILIAAPYFTASLTLNNILRYEGKAKFGTIGLFTGGVLNIAGDALFMCVFKMGIAGAGLSTALSQLVSFILLLTPFIRKQTETKLSLKYIGRDVRTYYDIAATGFPSLLRQGLNSTATMVLNNHAAIYGDEAVAAMSIVSRLSFFPLAAAIGIGQGFQPISAYNYGANKKQRVREAFFKALIGAEIVLALMSVPMYVYAPDFIRMLRDDPAVIEIGTRALRLMCAAQLTLPLTMMIEMGFQSTGQKLMATIGSSLRSGLLFIPSIIILSDLRGLTGIQEAQPISFAFTFIICLYLLKVYLDRLRDNAGSN